MGRSVADDLVERVAERVLRVVSEGGGTRQFGAAVRKLSVRLPNRLVG